MFLLPGPFAALLGSWLGHASLSEASWPSEMRAEESAGVGSGPLEPHVMPPRPVLLSEACPPQRVNPISLCSPHPLLRLPRRCPRRLGPLLAAPLPRPPHPSNLRSSSTSAESLCNRKVSAAGCVSGLSRHPIPSLTLDACILHLILNLEFFNCFILFCFVLFL